MCHDEPGFGTGTGGSRGPGMGRRFYRRGYGGRGGFPTREEWVERLEAHRERLERDLENVRDLISRLKDDPAPEPGA